MDDLINFGTVTPKSAHFLAACVQGKLNMLISGGTGTGKTTTLNAFLGLRPRRRAHRHDRGRGRAPAPAGARDHAGSPAANIEGQGEVKIRELVRNALRMRPDRIIVGEVRGPETLDMLQAMNTGHEGSLTTIHANSPRDALARLETLVLTAGVDLPLRAIREQVASAFDLLVQITRLVDGSRRISHVTEVLRMESDVITLQDIFLARPPDEESANAQVMRLLSPLSCTGLKPHFLEKMAATGVTPPGSVLPAGGPNFRPSFTAASYGGFKVRRVGLANPSRRARPPRRSARGRRGQERQRGQLPAPRGDGRRRRGLADPAQA